MGPCKWFFNLPHAGLTNREEAFDEGFIYYSRSGKCLFICPHDITLNRDKVILRRLCNYNRVNPIPYSFSSAKFMSLHWAEPAPPRVVDARRARNTIAGQHPGLDAWVRTTNWNIALDQLEVSLCNILNEYMDTLTEANLRHNFEVALTSLLDYKSRRL